MNPWAVALCVGLLLAWGAICLHCGAWLAERRMDEIARREARTAHLEAYRRALNGEARP